MHCIMYCYSKAVMSLKILLYLASVFLGIFSMCVRILNLAVVLQQGENANPIVFGSGFVSRPTLFPPQSALRGPSFNFRDKKAEVFFISSIFSNT